MAARKLVLLGLFLLSACAVKPVAPLTRIALLAPFEGRYREIGYQALYAARMALQDTASENIELLPLDDGGTQDRAVWRARGLAEDPLVQATIVLGYDAASAKTQAAFADVPVVIAGNWTEQPASDTIFMLASADLNDEIDANLTDLIDIAALSDPFIGGEMLALTQFPKLRSPLTGITILSSGSLPDESFVQRYRESDVFAPDPGLLAPLAYDAMGIVLEAVLANDTREETAASIAEIEYEGLNGVIRFADGYWQNAPVHRFTFNQSGELITATP
ncbi:MAG: ABC transporter substrate-binding protein [Anaerolineae bacterium]|nr:ABC transporter substrate-binding protein [Anaerolineae bacterium]